MLTVFFLTACTGTSVVPFNNSLSAADLLRAEPLTGPTDVPELGDADVLGLDQGMRDFLDAHVNEEHDRVLKMHELLDAMITEGSFGLKYDEITRTATETFDTRLGNCLSFTNMFVAMAREVGINARYQEVGIPPSWSTDGRLFVVSQHVNVRIDLGAVGIREVDFNIDDFESSYDRRVISDERAIAHYYSNVGAEHLQAKEPLEALRYFRKAVASDARFATVWSNLGVLYSKAGYLDYAEAAYLRALKVNPRELSAMGNLAKLYDRLGDEKRADWYRTRSDRYRMRNPYYRYFLARQAFSAEDYETAIEHLKFAVRKTKDDTFYFLMGMSYLQSGDQSAARSWLSKAERVAQGDGLKRDYHARMEELLNAR